MSGIKVLSVITRLNIGGPARVVLLLAKELAPRFTTLVVAGTPQAGEGELLEEGMSLERVPLTRPIRPLSDLRASAALGRIIAREQPQLVHTHMAKAGALVRLRRVPSTIRLVHTFHGHVLEGYFSKPVQSAFVALERKLARRCDALIAVSEEVRDALLDLGIGAPSQWHVIPLGLDLSSFLDVTGARGVLREALGLARGDRLVGVLGRLAPIKDHETLFRAVARIPDVHLAVLGNGELRGELQSYAERLRIAPRVHFAGWWSDVAVAMSDLDVVVLSSRNEGSPLSLIEALAAGKPVVSTDVGGVRSVVDHGETGFLVGAGDDEALAGRILQLLEDEEMRTSFGATGRSRAVHRFSKDRLISDTSALYEELLRQPSPRH